MDAVEFIKELNRMCKSFEGCYDCPAASNACCNTSKWREELISMVEKWSAEHPRKTQQQVFLEQWPNCMIDDDGAIGICPRNVDKNYICDLKRFSACTDCRREFWLQEVE